MASKVSMRLPDYARRFFAISEDLGVSLGMVFFGEEARTVVAQKTVAGINSEDPVFRHHSLTDAHRLYLKPDEKGSAGDTFEPISFSYNETLVGLKSLEVVPSLFEWTIFRLPGTKAFCMRGSENQKFGFGRPHPFKAAFKAHPSLAGPLEDYIPGAQPESRGSDWSFEPVWLRVLGFSDEEYILRFCSDWSPENNLVVFRADRFGPNGLSLPQDAPAALLAAHI